MTHPLVHDWNLVAPADPPAAAIQLDDETLRDGLQSPSVRAPAIDEKLRILHLIDDLGIECADIGLPGAGPRVVEDVERLVREIVSAKLHVRPNCAARTVLADIRPIVEIAQRTGMQLEVAAFIGSSPLRQYAEGWTLDFLERSTAEALSFAVREGLTVFFVTEDTLRADPASLRLLYTTAVRAGASRICVADTVGHPAPRHRIGRGGADRQRAHGPAAGESRAARVSARGPDEAAGVLSGRLGGDGRTDSGEVPGCRTRCLPDRHGCARGGHCQGGAQGGCACRRRRVFRRAGRARGAGAGNRRRPALGQVERDLLAGEARTDSLRRTGRPHSRAGPAVPDDPDGGGDTAGDRGNGWHVAAGLRPAGGCRPRPGS